ncbi:YscO family type III secretion system apparatus protein [bacterium]|nr:YscO family type III secretion system apparatus protein [bacterium]
MKQYPLAALLGIRIFRQDKAMRSLQSCERKLAKAKKAVKKAIKKHEDFLIWLVEEEENRYRDIMGTNMTLEDVDEFKLGLLNIRGRESLYLENILKARNHVQICKDSVKKAKKDLLEAQKGTLKIEAHKEIWVELMKLEMEKAEELELEDFIPRKKDLFDERLTA